MEINSILLDTNSYSFFIAGDDKVYREIEKAKAVYLSGIVLGELYAGFIRGRNLEDNERVIKHFLSEPRVAMIGISPKTASIYGEIIVNLTNKGKPIPTNDIWIAAQCLDVGAKLITFDKHFLTIPKLKVELY
jgi:tRNA(fMet)-specific endonuclease VapC